MTIHEELQNFFKEKGISQVDIAEDLGVAKSYVNALLAGRQRFGKKQAQIWSERFGLSKSWLLTGEGEMLMEQEPVPEISYTEGVPYYDVDFQLGFDELENVNSANPEYLIRMPGYEKATLWCNASGHSMEPEINNGDIIAMQQVVDFSFLPYGDIYGFITTNGMRTIKRLGRSDKEGFYRLIPTNREYDIQEIPITKIACVYRVMGAMKGF